MRVLSYIGISTLCLLGQSVLSQDLPQSKPSFIPDGSYITASYATGGTSPYLDNVLWLTWGATNSSDKHGKPDQIIKEGATSYARIPLGGDNVLEVSATITEIYYGSSNNWTRSKPNDQTLVSYRPGNYHGDFLVKLYNIGGEGQSNQLISGLKNFHNGQEVRVIIKSKAQLNGNPIRLSGMVLADAESLSTKETSSATAIGNWSVVDVMKNFSTTDVGSQGHTYMISKTKFTNGAQRLNLGPGTNQTTGVVGFMTFDKENPLTYDENDGYAVTFEATVKGEGSQAIALGLLPPTLDGSDAPKSYGSAWHILDGFHATFDNILPGETDGVEGKKVNINTREYSPGELKAITSDYLGSVGPDADGTPNYSNDAKGDDITGNAGEFEEDAWPKRPISYASYLNGQMVVEVPYVADTKYFIRGWIDFNLNGKFDDSEASEIAEVGPSTQGKANLTWKIPTDKQSKGSFVRIRMSTNKSQLASPSGVAEGGEVEDHKFYVVELVRTNSMLPSKAPLPKVTTAKSEGNN